MANYLHITLDVTEDALFGDVEAPESYEVDDFIEAVEKALKKEFPAVDVEVSSGNMYAVSSDLDEDTAYTEHWQGTASHIVNTEWVKWLEGLEY